MDHGLQNLFAIRVQAAGSAAERGPSLHCNSTNWPENDSEGPLRRGLFIYATAYF